MSVLSFTLAALAAASQPHVVMHYFDARGLGQAVRLLMSDANIDFTEERYTKETWPDVKQRGIETGLFPFGQMPVIEFREDGYSTTVSQSTVILQFLARRYGYYGDDESQWTRIEEMAGGTGDLRKRYGQFVYNKDAATNPELLENYKKEIATWLPHYERLLEGKVYTAGSSKPTFADILLFDLLDTCVLRVAPDALENLPHLRELYSLIHAREGIQRYLKSPQHHKHANGPSAFFDTPNHTPPALQQEEL